jgi:DUF1365 family protein
MTASAIYEGSVRHRRFGAPGDEFEHALALAYLDLDELPGLLGGRLVAPRPGLVRFRRRDFLGDPSVPLADAVRERTGTDGPVRLLANLRVFGHCFNPVAFYYCFGSGGKTLDAVLAEVTNTPWGERHSYLVRGEGARVMRGVSDKRMHVSPFMPMDQHYRWNVATPGPSLSVHIENHDDAGKTFDATLSLRRRELTQRSLAAVTARYPFATLRVLALIYGHAAALKLRGARVHPHPRAAA